MNTPVLLPASADRRTARMLHCPPRGLQQQAMLRVHEDGLAGRHPEEGRVEPRDVVEESRAPSHHLPGGVRIGIVELLDVPPVGRHLRDRIAPLLQQVPELVGIGGAGEAHRVADDGEPVARALEFAHPRPQRRELGVVPKLGHFLPPKFTKSLLSFIASLQSPLMRSLPEKNNARGFACS